MSIGIGNAVRVELAQHVREAVEERHVRLGGPVVEAEHLELDVGADDRADLREHVVRAEARAAARPSRSTSISLGMTLTADAAVDDRRVDRVAQHRLVARGPASPEQPQRRVARARVEQRAQHDALRARQRGGHRLEHLPCDGRDVDRRPLSVERARASGPSRAIAPPRIGRAAWPPGPRTVARSWHICFSATWIGIEAPCRPT